MTQYHIINNWLWLGAVSTLDEATTPARMPAGFDHDGYKILCRPVLSGQYDIIELRPENARHPVNLAEQQFSLAFQQS